MSNTRVISFHYTLTDDQGKVIDSSINDAPLNFLEGSGQIIPGLEKELISLQQGEKRNVHVPYAEAYGPYDQKLLYQAPRDKFPESNIKIGDIFELNHEQARQLVTVVDFNDKEVTLDANHPLAGKNLNFAVEVTSVREATASEIEHGHVH